MTRPPEAMEVIGVARYFAAACYCQVLPPTAPGDRNVTTPEMLKALGWWVPGKDGAQSACGSLDKSAARGWRGYRQAASNRPEGRSFTVTVAGRTRRPPPEPSGPPTARARGAP